MFFILRRFKLVKISQNLMDLENMNISLGIREKKMKKWGRGCRL